MKTQNWFAVALDFVIVVFGVVIGIQVANWNEDRQDQIQAARFLDRLEAEFAQQMARTDRGIASHQQSLQATSRLIHGMRTGSFDENRINDDINLATSVATPPGPSTVFQEFVSTGKTELIRSDKLRSALYEYNSYISFFHTQYGYFTAPFTQAGNALMHAQTIKTTGIPSKDFDQLYVTQSVNTPLLLSNPEIHSTLQSAYGTHDNVHLVLVNIRERMQNIQTLIKSEKARVK